MKLLQSLLLASAVQAQTLCTGVTNLISATCSPTGFEITVDETCRGTHYSWINFGGSTFVDGVQGTVEMPGSLGATCGAVGTTGSWVYTFDFTECNVGAATGPAASTDPNDPAGVEWYTYSVYLNYDNAIDSTLGTGNLRQMDQTLVQCRVPANLQENAIATAIVVVDTADLVPDESSDVNLWEDMSLDVYIGGTASTVAWGANPIAAGDSIELGEHVKLLVNPTFTVGTDYNVAIRDCWASTVENVRTGGDTGGIDFDATGVNVNGVAVAHETVKFYDNMCPTFNWVTSFADHSAIDSNTEIELRQFDFNGATSGDFFYHCEVDICLIGTNSPDEDCVPDPTCSAITANSPARRRRSILSSKVVRRDTLETDSSTGPDSIPFKVNKDKCEEPEIEGDVIICLDQDRPRSNAKTAALSALTGVFLCAIH